METSTVADLRNNFAAVSERIEPGESITITKPGAPFALLTPTRRQGATPEAVDWMARLRRMDPNGPVRGGAQAVVSEMRGET